jgi:apolipoprotein N-acyltransferase
MTPYAKLGDKPVMGLILLILGVAVRVKRYQVSAG